VRYAGLLSVSLALCNVNVSYPVKNKFHVRLLSSTWIRSPTVLLGSQWCGSELWMDTLGLGPLRNFQNFRWSRSVAFRSSLPCKPFLRACDFFSPVCDSGEKVLQRGGEGEASNCREG
jgi:hypothetical protein